MPQYVDLHSHILPSLDDGAEDLETSVLLARSLAGLGFGELHATPHQRAGYFLPSHEAMRQALGEVTSELSLVLPGVSLSLGAENYWDDVLTERVRQGQIPSYDGGRAFLYEINPLFIPPGMEATLFQARLAGCLPVMAHPERYAAIQRAPDLAADLARQSALLVDLAALAASTGRAETKTARRLLEEGVAHAVASDMHSLDDQKAIAGGMDWIAKRLGAKALTRLLAENPRRILEGELP